MGESVKSDFIRHDTIFFFGAGASVDAGIPDTYKFVDDFLKEVEEKNPLLFSSLNEIISIRKKFNERTLGEDKARVDVEQLLSTLEHLKTKDNEILLDFFGKEPCKFEINEKDVSELKSSLEEFIRKVVVVKDERKLDYLKELLNFKFPLEIYSVNYDTCIEQLCHINFLKYTDGFDIYWNPENFKDDKFNVKLFKLHGSIIWYESNTKEYLKIPVRGFDNDEPINLRLITGETVNPLLIYPMQKWEYIEPLTELQLLFKKRLVEKDTKLLVVVGYSFRDDYIIRMLWDASRRNEELHIVLVDPNAQEIFEKRLKFLDSDKTILSRIADRVICLPYPFSKIIYFLKNEYLGHLRNAIHQGEHFINQEKLGDSASDWQTLLRICINCEFSTKGETVIEKLPEEWLRSVLWDGGYAANNIGITSLPERIRLSWKALLHSVIARDGFEEKWIERLNKLFEFTHIENLAVQNFTSSGFSLKSFLVDNKLWDFIDVWRVLDSMETEFKRKTELLEEQFRNKLDGIVETYKRLIAFEKYLATFGRIMRWQIYFNLREDLKEPISNSFEIFPEDISIECSKKISRMIYERETKELQEIFKGKTFIFQLNADSDNQ